MLGLDSEISNNGPRYMKVINYTARQGYDKGAAAQMGVKLGIKLGKAIAMGARADFNALLSSLLTLLTADRV